VSTRTSHVARIASLESGIARWDTPTGGGAGSSFRVEGLTRDIRFKIARERFELEGAYELLAASHRGRGSDGLCGEGHPFLTHRGRPDTAIFVAVHAGRVQATLSLVPDSAALGLPMEQLYGPEIANLRREGRRMAEPVGLADAGLTAREFVQVVKALCTLAMQYHSGRGGDTWVVAIDPRHRGLYQGVLGFAPLGPRRHSPAVQDDAAGAYVLDHELMAANAPRMYREVYGDPLPSAVPADRIVPPTREWRDVRP
jgi:hypothetical protein